MRKSFTADYQMLTNVADFGAACLGKFPKNSAAKEIVDGLAASVTDLSKYASDQFSAEAARRTSVDVRAAARGALRKRLLAADQVARVLNKNGFRAPVKHSDQALLNSGHAFIVDADSMKKEFSQHALSPDDMGIAVEALEKARLEYSVAMSKRSAAIRAFVSKLDEAKGYMQRLDALVTMALADDAETMVAWKAATTPVRVSTRKTVAAVVPVPVPVPPSVVSPATAA